MRKNLILILIYVQFMQAQQTKQNFSFTLKQAIEHALQYNYEAINAGKDIEAAQKKKWETTTMGLPQINGTLDYLNNFELQRQGATGGGPFGGAPNEVQTFAFGTKHIAISQLTLRQLIFDGSYLVGLQSSKAYISFFENAKKKSNNEIKEQVTISYGNVLLADESIKVLEKNIAILEKNYSEINQIYKNGLGEEESVEQIAITLASVKNNLNNVKRMREIGLKMLKIQLGIELENELALTENLESLANNNLEKTLVLTDFKVENAIDYQIVSNVTEQKRLLLKLEKSKALPSLGAALNFGANTFANKFTFLSTSQKWNHFSNLGVSLNVPIFSSLGRSAKTQQAKLALEQAKTTQTQTEQLLKLQYQKAKTEFEFSVEEYATSKSNLNLAERIEKKQQIKFKEGLSTSFEFTEAQRQLYANQQIYLQTMVNIINKRAALEKVLN